MPNCQLHCLQACSHIGRQEGHATQPAAPPTSMQSHHKGSPAGRRQSRPLSPAACAPWACRHLGHEVHSRTVRRWARMCCLYQPLRSGGRRVLHCRVALSTTDAFFVQSRTLLCFRVPVSPTLKISPMARRPARWKEDGSGSAKKRYRPHSTAARKKQELLMPTPATMPHVCAGAGPGSQGRVGRVRKAVGLPRSWHPRRPPPALACLPVQCQVQAAAPAPPLPRASSRP